MSRQGTNLLWKIAPAPLWKTVTSIFAAATSAGAAAAFAAAAAADAAVATSSTLVTCDVAAWHEFSLVLAANAVRR